MPNERISMSKLKQLIGLQSSNLGVRALGRALGLSVGAVSKYFARAGSGRLRPKRSRSWNWNGGFLGCFWRQNRGRWCLRTAPGSAASSNATGT
jgi:hypothetical protein